MKVNYAEKQYEQLFQAELTRGPVGRRVVLAPISQVVEARAGYDLGLYSPRWHRLWRLMGVAYAAGGLVSAWNPDLTLQDGYFKTATNVFFQFKRPELLIRANSRHYPYFQGPYFRFGIDRSANSTGISQHDRLLRLEQMSWGEAHVRYAAPTVESADELLRIYQRRQLLEMSVYLEPSQFGPRHTYCNYDRRLNVLLNREPDVVVPDRWDSLSESISMSAREGQPFEAIIESALGWAREIDPQLVAITLDSLQTYDLPIPLERSREYLEVAAALNVFSAAGVVWWMAFSQEE